MTGSLPRACQHAPGMFASALPSRFRLPPSIQKEREGCKAPLSFFGGPEGSRSWFLLGNERKGVSICLAKPSVTVHKTIHWIVLFTAFDSPLVRNSAKTIWRRTFVRLHIVLVDPTRSRLIYMVIFADTQMLFLLSWFSIVFTKAENLSR